MTNAELLAKIKAEIERIKESYDVYLARVTKNDFLNELDAFLDFLETLESEKPMNLEGFEEEMIAYIERHFHTRYDETLEVGNDPLTTYDFEEIARHFAQWGAKWQAKQDQETIELAEDHAYLAGSVNEREKMMKEAVEGEIQMRYSGCLCAKTIRAINEDKFKLGDKVRVIVLPKEDSHEDK